MSQTAQRQEVQRELAAGDEKRGISAAVDGKVDLNVREEGLEISIVEKGGGRRVHRSWVFRMNEVIANWYGMQLGIMNTFCKTNTPDRVRTPPPSYEESSNPSNEEDYILEDRSIFRTICQLIVLLLGIAIAVGWTYHYINRQSQNPPSSTFIILELVFLTIYLAMFGFFLCTFMLRLVFPWMIRLGDYATHEAGRAGKVLTIGGVVMIWSVCVVWIFAFPLIPAVGGLIARKSS